MSAQLHTLRLVVAMLAPFYDSWYILFCAVTAITQIRFFKISYFSSHTAPFLS